MEQHHWWFVGRYKILRQAIEWAVAPGVGSKIVDIGSGTGAIVAALVRDYRVIGFEPSADGVTLARQRFPGVEFRQSDPLNLPRQAISEADLILLLDVIEHIPDDQKFLSELVDAMTVGAHALITVPADMRLWGAQDEAVGHVRRYDSGMLLRLVDSLPVKPAFITYFNTRLYPIVRLARWITRATGRSLGRDGTDFQMLPKPINGLLTALFAGERRVVGALLTQHRKQGYRYGVSLMMMLTKI